MKKQLPLFVGAAALVLLAWLVLRGCSTDSSPDAVPVPAMPEAPVIPDAPVGRNTIPPLEDSSSPAAVTATVSSDQTAEPDAAPRYGSVELVTPVLETGGGRVLLASQGGSLGTEMPPLPRGQAALELDGRSVAPENHSGHYQRVLIGGETTAEVALQWPDAGQRPVLVHAIQGGQINGHDGPRTLRTDSDGRLAFRFSTNQNPGRYEVLLRSGPSEEVLHFWVPAGHPALDPYGL